MHSLRAFKRTSGILLVLLLLAAVLGSSALPPGDVGERARAFTRQVEFDYVGWMLTALKNKLSQGALSSDAYLPETGRKNVVLDYLDLVTHIQQGEGELETLYTDPGVMDPLAASAGVRHKLSGLYAQRSQLGPLAEAILQGQIAEVVKGAGLTLGGQALPPILYHSTPLPMALIISPRNVIRQDADISLLPDLSVDQQEALEAKVDKTLGVSSLVVPIGGVGVYPTMVYQTSDLGWLLEVVSHEWTHNFLTLRPLGINYFGSPELRTMNETVANISGKEIGREVLKRYYPELVPPGAPAQPPAAPQPEAAPAPIEFDFNEEMRITRETADQMLADGKIDEAEAYMEQRRQLFWDHGYQIRKLNQAYFAFHGAYADQPGGAAGEDPVGAAVRKLRAQSPSLTVFLKRVAWMWSVDQLYRAVQSQN